MFKEILFSLVWYLVLTPLMIFSGIFGCGSSHLHNRAYFVPQQKSVGAKEHGIYISVNLSSRYRDIGKDGYEEALLSFLNIGYYYRHQVNEKDAFWLTAYPVGMHMELQKGLDQDRLAKSTFQRSAYGTSLDLTSWGGSAPNILLGGSLYAALPDNGGRSAGYASVHYTDGVTFSDGQFISPYRTNMAAFNVGAVGSDITNRYQPEIGYFIPFSDDYHNLGRQGEWQRTWGFRYSNALKRIKK